MGSVMYFGGLILIVMGYPMFTLFGFSLQLYGVFLLFKSFMKTAFAYLQTMPVIGPLLRDSPIIHKIVNTVSNSGTATESYSSKKFEV